MGQTKKEIWLHRKKMELPLLMLVMLMLLMLVMLILEMAVEEMTQLKTRAMMQVSLIELTIDFYCKYIHKSHFSETRPIKKTSIFSISHTPQSGVPPVDKRFYY